MLSVKFYRNLKKKLFYGIYFNKFHTICKEKFKKCDHRIGNTFTFCTDIPFAAHFNCAGKKSTIYVKNCRGPEVKTQKCMHKYYLDMY